MEHDLKQTLEPRMLIERKKRVFLSRLHEVRIFYRPLLVREILRL